MGFVLAKNHDPFALQRSASSAICTNTLHVIVLLGHRRDAPPSDSHPECGAEEFVDPFLSGCIGWDLLHRPFGELIIDFASSNDNDDKLIEKNALGELRTLVQSELGLDFGAASIPVDARKTLRRLILLGEFATTLLEKARPGPLKMIMLPEKLVHLDTLRHLCTTWRNRLDFRDGYISVLRHVRQYQPARRSHGEVLAPFHAHAGEGGPHFLF